MIVRDRSVHSPKLISFDLDVLFDEFIIVLLPVVEDDVRPPRAAPADVRPKHNAVEGVSPEGGGGETGAPREELDVGAAAVEVLLVLYLVLYD